MGTTLKKIDGNSAAWVLGGLAATGLVTVAAVVLNNESLVAGVGVVAFAGVCTWLLLPQRKNQTPKLLMLLIVAFMFSSLLPSTVSLAVQGVAVAASIIAWLKVPAAERRGKFVVGAAFAILVLWAALMFHPNVPDVATGLLGFRKTAFCVAGVIAGCAIPKNLIGSFELVVVRVLILALGVSIIAFLFIPALEALVNRSADEYTSLIGGKKRLQGVFAGPFHVALAGMLLMGWGLVKIKVHRFTALIALVVGTLALYLTLVRSAYIGVALMLVALVLVSPSIGKFLGRLIAGAVLAIAVGFVVFTQAPTLADTALSIFDFDSDNRFLNRLPQYAKGIAMFQEFPLIGMGAGSAGDTLGPAFAMGFHVTPHNMFLKILVEGGLIGAATWLALGVGLIRTTNWHSAGGRLTLVSFAALIGLGLTGSAIDTLPVSFLVFFFAGLAVNQTPKVEQPPATPVLSDAYRHMVKETV
ncbi:O-antigen ligase [Arthrobacter sp. ISL-95]|uniref:O-antigen ligase family protein n=1 Tax=Arthrobacter sp. ISL-95 TaxID=2819116 RepID=UPI001BEAF10D|nr:O-antigen ligase family protein [Arthrobacter sp. ISL-95]MBT2585628.1 O-antigen ligase family protein [Arthrobacter sp. ISL-95]